MLRRELLALGLLFTGGLADDDSEPSTYVPTEIYDEKFCRDRTNDWQFNGGTWTWVANGCKIKSDNSSYNMGWLGRRDPISLEWEDYSCKLEFTYSETETDASRGLVTYAQSTDSSFEYLNGYECAIVTTDSVDYLKLYVNAADGSTELASTEVSLSTSGTKYLELEVYSQWKNCYLTDDDNVTTISATDSSYSEGSVGIKTSYAATTFKEIACYDLGTLAPTTSLTPSLPPSPLPTIAEPTVNPTLKPTDYPTLPPSSAPTTGPTPYPSPPPTVFPSSAPTIGPTPYPSPLPSPIPTIGPSPYPSILPSPAPSEIPTIGPTPYPSILPSPSPTLTPSHAPTATPSVTPSHAPTVSPSHHPTDSPTAAPSPLPTVFPSRVPSSAPSEIPTIGPTPYPSTTPSPAPTSAPTLIPSSAPTGIPTTVPIPAPTSTPSEIPTIGPSPYPSVTPTPKPTDSPSLPPTPAPSVAPTTGPTPYPSSVPSPAPSAKPVFEPTSGPEHPPTVPPTRMPTRKPSLMPTHLPTSPTIQPTPAPSSDSGSTTVSAFGTADIGFAVMGVVLLVACCICCLAGIGYNSKRKKRERQNALAWDQISDSISESEGGAPVEGSQEREYSESDANPMQTDSMNMESLWPSALFGSPAPATPVPYQAAATEDDGASMWPGAAVKKGDEKEKSEEPSMWPGTEGSEQVSSDADAAYSGPEAEVSFFDSMWPTADTDGKDKGASNWYGSSSEAAVVPAAGESWQIDEAMKEEETLVAPVVADTQDDDDGEEFHF